MPAKWPNASVNESIAWVWWTTKVAGSSFVYACAFNDVSERPPLLASEQLVYQASGTPRFALPTHPWDLCGARCWDGKSPDHPVGENRRPWYKAPLVNLGRQGSLVCIKSHKRNPESPATRIFRNSCCFCENSWDSFCVSMRFCLTNQKPRKIEEPLRIRMLSGGGHRY